METAKGGHCFHYVEFSPLGIRVLILSFFPPPQSKVKPHVDLDFILLFYVCFSFAFACLRLLLLAFCFCFCFRFLLLASPGYFLLTRLARLIIPVESIDSAPRIPTDASKMPRDQRAASLSAYEAADTIEAVPTPSSRRRRASAPTEPLYHVPTTTTTISSEQLRIRVTTGAPFHIRYHNGPFPNTPQRRRHASSTTWAGR